MTDSKPPFRPLNVPTALILITCTALIGCVSDAPEQRSEPDYARVFPTDRVQRIDVIVSPQDWESMLDNVERVAGARPGERRGNGGDPVDVCQGKEEGASCSFDGLTGTCTGDEGARECIPSDTGPDPSATACEGKAVGDACVSSGVSGVCESFDGALACISNGGQDGLLNTPKPDYIQAEVRFEGMVWHHVGFRPKGNNSLLSSLHSMKLPFRFKFDAFEEQHPETRNQRFFGFQHLTMINHATDDSYMRPFITTNLFREMGVASVRMAYYRLYIDRGNGPEYAGLYAMADMPDDPFLDSEFGSHDGNLYKPDGESAALTDFDQRHFEKKNNEEQADYSDVQALIRVLGDTSLSAEERRRQVEAIFDMEHFIRFLAVTRATNNWDTYGGIPHNYYLYNAGGVLQFIPWDFDLSFDIEGQTVDLRLQDGLEWPLINLVATDETYQARYRQHLTSFAAGPFSEASVRAEVNRVHEMISPHVVGAEGEQDGDFSLRTGEESFNAARAALLEAIQGRQNAVREFLGG